MGILLADGGNPHMPGKDVGMLLVVCGDPHRPCQGVGMPLIDGGVPHLLRGDDVAGGTYCNIY